MLTRLPPADEQSGLSNYQVAAGSLPTNDTVVTGEQGEGFPVQWDPRYAAAMGLSADVDRFENYKVHEKPRNTSIEIEEDVYAAQSEDSPGGFYVSGVLPVDSSSGVRESGAREPLGCKSRTHADSFTRRLAH